MNGNAPRRRLNSGRGLLRSAARILGWGYLAAVVLWWVLSTISGDQLLPVRWLNYAVPWLGLTVIFLAGGSLLARQRVLTVVAALFALILLAPYGGQMARGVAGLFYTPPVSETALTVLSYNTWGRNQNMADVAAVIAAQGPDIVMLQEVRDADALLRELERLYPDRLLHVAWAEGPRLMSLSLHPLDNQGVADKVQRAIVHLPGGDVALRNVHFERGIADDNVQFGQADALATDVEQWDGPVIVAGDFNMTQHNDGYRRLRRALTNAHEAAGQGFGFTFATRGRRLGTFGPVVRIDHVFVGGGIEVLSARPLSDAGGSDHFPVVVTLAQIYLQESR